MAKQTFKEVINDKAQNLLNAVALWGAFYRANPHRFAKDFLNINLRLFQKINLYEMMHNVNTIYLASRGQGLVIFCNNISTSNILVLGGTVSKYTCNEDYFEVIDTSNKAYWLGFLYADGYVSKNARVLSITLCVKDRNHLQKFLDDLQSNAPIRDRISTCNNKEYYSSRVDIYSSKICNDLINKGCIPQKTYVITLPDEQQVPHELMRDFLRGFFDGDGSITFSSVNGKKYWVAEISGIEAMLRDIQRYLLNETVVMTTTKIRPSKKGFACVYSVNGESCMKFLSYMYDNAIVYLDRKYELYCEVLESFKTRKKYGVSWHKIRKKYQAYISDNKKIIYLGLFDTYEDAVKAREEAEILKLQKEKALLVSND